MLKKYVLASAVLATSVALAASWPDASPAPIVGVTPQNVRVSMAGLELKEEAPHIDPCYPASYMALEAAQWPEALARVEHYRRGQTALVGNPVNRALSLLFPAFSLMAPPSVQGMANYPVATPLEASWSLQGLSEDEQETAEMVDTVDYGTDYGG
jgi:hypothetical protein